MTKRPSPFEPNICRQSKIHLNNYENDVIALRNIEERTLMKLLEGAKKLHSNFPNNDNHSNSDNEFHNRNGKWRQTCVTKYIRVNGKKIHENARILTSLEPQRKCFYCETPTSLVYQCVECSEFYCSTCSFVSYDSLEDKRICLSCS